MSRELIYGRKPVLEALRGFRTVHRVLGTRAGVMWLKKAAREYDVRLPTCVEIIGKQELHNILRRSDHQGLAAEVDSFRYASLRSVLPRLPDVVVLIDGVTDPQNLGAIIRTAHIFGAGCVIIPMRNSASITPVVVHSSAGATEHTNIAKVESLTHALQLLGERGYITVATVKPSDGSIPLSRFTPEGRVAIVLGSEGEGISGKVLKKCAVKVHIPQKGAIDSLNVSVAAGIVLHGIAEKLGLFNG